MSKKYYAFTLLGLLILLTGTFGHTQNPVKEKIKWDMVSVWPRNNPIYQNGMEKLAKDITAISNGQIEIKYYADGEFEDIESSDVFYAVSGGKVEMGFGNSIYWAADKIPGSDFWYAVPFGLSAKDMHAWLFRGGGLEIWRDIYEPFNIIPFPVGNTGSAMGGWFRNRIKSITDFKYMNIRMTGLHAKVMQKLGAIPKWMQLYYALEAYEKGDLDTIVGLGPYFDLWYRLNRGPKYYYYPGWQEPCGVLSLIINKKAWEFLPEHLQKTIDVVCGNTYQYIYNQFEHMNSLALKELQREGVELIEFPPDVMDYFRRLTKEVLEEEAAKNKAFKRIYEAFKKFKEENIDSGWGKIHDGAVYSERMLELISELSNSKVAKARQKGNNSVIITFSGDLSFSSNSAIPKPALSSEIKRSAKIIREYSTSIKLIKVEGHTESQGDACSNWQLSKDRAYAVVKLLIENGIKNSLIKAIPYGAESPIADNNTLEGRRQNRRVEIIIEF
jgi:TRAP-type mannitol/chloroaromatic compound transport system substrate-binding protein